MSKRREIPHFDTAIIETHCHLDYLEGDELAATLAQSAAVGIERIITIAVSPTNLDRVLELTRVADNIWGTQGIHPHEAGAYSDAVEQAIRTRAADERILAIGEIGLDYHYDHADRSVQRNVFERQLQLAVELDMPVVIHTREADDDTRAILQSFSPLLRRKGVLHSFTSSPALAEYCLAEGFMLGFNGIATFNRADNVREVIALTPVQQILLETDAPYLTPVPYRGRPNAPFYLPLVAEKVAEVKQLDVELMLQQVYRNSMAIFFRSRLMEYIVGQRWVSHADAQLGLGVIVDIDGRRVTLAFPAVAEERTYATESAPLSRLRFKVGDRISTVDKVELLVTRVTEQQGLLLYTGNDHYDQQRTVSELELDAFVQLTTPQQRLLNGHFDKSSEFALRVATFIHSDRLQRSIARGLMGSRTSLLPHQVYIANEVGQRHAPRVLLADEVGLGKTIEAGMIIHQQLLTGRASRVLVLVPPSLLHQWLVEMLRRFNLHFALFDAERLAEMPQENPFESEQLVLCSLALFEARPDLQAHAIAADWDLVGIDEAHHLHWSAAGAGEDYLFVEALSRASAGLLLLTATPEQIGQASHFARLRLLDPDRFHDLESFQAEEQQYRHLSELADALEAGEQPTDLPAGLDPTAPAATLIAQMLDRHGTGRVLFRNTRAAVAGFPQRVLHRYPLPVPEQYSFARVELQEQLHPEQPYHDESWLSFDSRVQWLERRLKELRPAKALVICARAETAVALEHHLHLRAGIRSAAFYEGLSIIERDRAAAYFADEINGAQTLVCSEIGSEGRNFQFAHHLILFDLPLNPDLLEQRIGRLDRIGQQCDVEIHVPYLEGTAQETLVDWYDRGMNLFTDSCSAGYMIFETFREQLLPQLLGRTAAFDELLAATADFTAQTRRELREGRDRLLERNSCKPEIAAALIEEIRANEAGDALEKYLEDLCEAFGVDWEIHSEQALILRPSEHMLTGHFPYLQEDGTSITFSRDKALAREDMEFASWEHPMVLEAMDMVRSTELGNAAIGTIRLKGVAPATMLLEALYTVNCVAPRSLQVERFLPLSPLRLLVDARGKDLAQLLPHARLNELIQSVKKSTALAIIKQVHLEVEAKMALATGQAEQQLQAILAGAEQAMRTDLGAELARMEALRQVNPSIRQEELDHLRHRIDECAIHIRHASLQLQALRLVITT